MAGFSTISRPEAARRLLTSGVVRLSVGASGGGLPTSFGAGESDLTVNFGGGVRMHLGKNWGLRPDVKVVRIPGQTYVRSTVGIFYQFGS